MESLGQRRLKLALHLVLIVISTVQVSARKSQPTCHTFECTSLAAGMVSMMNQSVDPCEDFYTYTCGNFANAVAYNSHKVVPNEELGKYLFEDSLTLMQATVQDKIYELLLTDDDIATVDSSDPDIQHLYSLTRSFFRSCGAWVRRATTAQYNFHYANELFFKAIMGHLMRSIRPADGTQLQLEEIVAALVRAGGNAFVSVELPSLFPSEVMENRSDATDLLRTELRINTRLWHGYNSQTYADYFRREGISSYLTFFFEFEASLKLVRKGLAKNKKMTHAFAKNCSLHTGWQTTYRNLSELEARSRCASGPNSSFSWTLFFESLFQSPVNGNWRVQINDECELISAMNYFKQQPVYVENNGWFSDQVSYLIFDWLMSFGDFLPRNLRKNWLENHWQWYPKNVLKVPKEHNRVQGCIQWVQQFMQPALESMYRKAHHPEGFEGVADLVELVNTVSIDSVTLQSWIRNDSREAIVEKLQAIQSSIGHNEMTNEQLKHFYNTTLAEFRNVTLSRNGLEHSLGDLAGIILPTYMRTKLDVMSGNSPVNGFMLANPLTVKAYFEPFLNRVILPMTLIEPPVYHQSYPAYINLGNLGFIIGHEIGHAFDTTGRVLNRLGRSEKRWDNETQMSYEERARCVQNCYRNYTLYPGGPKHWWSSSKTLDGNIADNLGLKAAFGALQRLNGSTTKLPFLPTSLNQDQMLFIRAAQSLCVKVDKRSLEAMLFESWSPGSPLSWRDYSNLHAPHRMRVTGMMQNSREFARAFRCTPGQAMHPEQKCTFW